MTLYKVVEKESGEEINFYDVTVKSAKFLAEDCKRHMKSLTGREYEVIVYLEDGTTKSLKEYEQELQEI